MAEQTLFEYSGFRLVRRPDTPNFYINWSKPGARCPNRRSSGTSDFEQAKRVVVAFAEEQRLIGKVEPTAIATFTGSPSPLLPPIGSTTNAATSVPLLEVLCRYAERMQFRPSYETIRHSLKVWTMFCTEHQVVYVHELTLSAQERFIEWRRLSWHDGKPLSNGTINRFLEDIRAALRDAWQRGEIHGVPYIKLLPKPKPRDRFLNSDQCRRLLECCTEPHVHRFVLMGLHTLQRPCALLRLRTTQVSLEWNQIDFLPPEEVQTNKRKPVVPITATLRPEMERAIAQSRSGYVIEYEAAPVKRMKRSFAAAANRAGVPWATPGILRHSGATMLAAAGVEWRQIAAMMGHTTSEITERVYAKRRPDFLRDATIALDRLFPTAA